MELFSAEFFSALLAIIVIDLVLAGDNAIVIALAARNLPPKLRTRAIVWGTAGAIIVRSAMTLVVVWLLKIPGLLAIGGSLLIWIAYKLLADNDGGAEHGHNPADNFWAAMKTIVVADALMGLDNVLAVAGAAHGSFLLVVLGLLISIPIVIWGSQLILKFVERYPIIVYVGSGVLAWTSVKMITSEPVLANTFASYPALKWALYVVVIGGVLGAGYLTNYRKLRSRVAEHLVDSDVKSDAPAAAVATSVKGGSAMDKVLIPVDGSANSLKAVEHVVSRFLNDQRVQVHLVHVRTPLTQHAARFINGGVRAKFHHEEGEKALAGAREVLRKHGVPYSAHIELGDKAETINRVAQRLRVTNIVMGTARSNSLTRMLEDSVTSKVLELAQVPVEVVAGEEISTAEKFGFRAGMGATALALIYMAID